MTVNIGLDSDASIDARQTRSAAGTATSPRLIESPHEPMKKTTERRLCCPMDVTLRSDVEVPAARPNIRTATRPRKVTRSDGL